MAEPSTGNQYPKGGDRLVRLNKKTFISGIEKLLYAFPNWRFDCTNPKAMALWFDAFNTMTDQKFNDMLELYVESEKGYPTIAGLKEYANKKPTFENDTEANREYVRQVKEMK